MRILAWGINYAPERTGIAPYNVALCEHLRAAGHDARMLTTFAYYPAWKKEPADRGRLYRTDTLRGVPVHRCWHYVPARVSALRRIIHEGTFVTTSFLRLLALGLRWRPDAMVVVSPPLLLGAAAWIAGKILRAPWIFHIQDLQPDAAVGLGMLRPSRFTRMLYALEALAYRKAARVSVIAEGMRRALLSKGVPAEKVVMFPNGTPFSAAPLPPRGRFRARVGLREDEFLAVYSGNLGVKQGLGLLLDAAPALHAAAPRVRLVLCGGGAQREELAARLAREQPPNVSLFPLQDDPGYAELLADADVCLITQQPGTGQFFFPSKLLAALAAARPVLAVADADSELAVATHAGSFGTVTPADDVPAFVAALASLSGMPRADLDDLGARGAAWGEQFRFDRVLPAFVRELEALAGPSAR